MTLILHMAQRAFDRIDTVSGEVLNIGGGPANTLSLLELVDKLECSFGKRLDPPFAAWRPGDQRVFVADVRKAEICSVGGQESRLTKESIV